jgi:hypothetical protein
MPSLPAMAYLEKEIRQTNVKIDSFHNSKEYIDYMFDKNEAADDA